MRKIFFVLIFIFYFYLIIYIFFSFFSEGERVALDVENAVEAISSQRRGMREERSEGTPEATDESDTM